MIDWAAVRRRIRFIGSALGLAPTQIEEVLAEIAKGNEAKLIAFAETHGQSLDWIVTGDLAPMVRSMAGKVSSQLPLPLALNDEREG
jgi:hypothetical protein